MKYYELVHVRPDKSERLIKLTYEPEKIHAVTEKFQWAGTWVTPERKLLRYNRGELHIREKLKQARIVEHKEILVGGRPWYECTVKYHEDLRTICLNESVVVGYNKDGKIAWSSGSMNELADKYVGKELAYQCSRYYEKYLEEYHKKGAM